MAMKIRLTRMGSKKRPFYRVVALDSAPPAATDALSSTSGTTIRWSNPTRSSSIWKRSNSGLAKGAEPSNTVRSLLKKAGKVAQASRGGGPVHRSTHGPNRFGSSDSWRATTRRHGGDVMLKEMIEYIAKSLVDNPDEVHVSEVEGEQTSVIELKVAKEDLGKVIGKQGRTARAMRTLLGAASTKARKRSVLEILE